MLIQIKLTNTIHAFSFALPPGYNNSYLNAVALSTQLWNNVNVLKYVSYDKYLTIHFDRKHGSGSSFRGFVAGSIMFSK